MVKVSDYGKVLIGLSLIFRLVVVDYLLFQGDKFVQFFIDLLQLSCIFIVLYYVDKSK